MRSPHFIVITLLSFCFNGHATLIHDFDIRLSFNAEPDYSLTSSQQKIFYKAESLWEHFVIGYDNNVIGPGLDILASSQDIDGADGILAQAGPTYGGYTPRHFYATQDVMSFDKTDLLAMEKNNSLFAVVFHEMAHVMGFGTLWDPYFNNIYDENNNYIGKYGLAAYQLEFDPSATFVPVEQDGGPGTAGGHWDEAYGGIGGDSRVMTGWFNENPYISLTTINSFRDLGYVINPDYILAKVPEPSILMLLALAFLGLINRKKCIAVTRIC